MKIGGAPGDQSFLDSFEGLFYNRKEVECKKTAHRKQVLILFFFISASSWIILPPSVLSQPASIKLKVVAEQANIRLEPDISSIIIRQIPQGDILESTGKQGEWYAVRFKPREGKSASGYVHESLVMEIEPPPQKKDNQQKKKTINQSPHKQEKPQQQQEPKIFPPPIVKPESPQPFTPLFEIQISGGGNVIGGGDVNSGSQGLVDYYSDTLGVSGTGDVNPVRLSPIFGGELSFPLSSQLSWGIGIEYFRGTKESQVKYSTGSAATSLTIRPKIQAIPVRLMLSYSFIPAFYLKGGLSYYFARCSYFYQIQEEELTRQWEGQTNAKGLGWMGGCGFVHNLTSHLSIMVEVTGRFAKIDGFQGKDTFKDSNGQVLVEEGTLYLYQAETTDQISHPLLFIRQAKPAEAGVISAREAEIDFSGVSIKAGFKIRF